MYVTNATTDIDCLRNWDYYAKDKKTIIAANIATTTMRNKDAPWCATKYVTVPTDRIKPEGNQNIIDKHGEAIVGVVGSICYDRVCS